MGVRLVIKYHGEPTEPTRTEPARGPPQGDCELDQPLGLSEDDVWA